MDRSAAAPHSAAPKPRPLSARLSVLVIGFGLGAFLSALATLSAVSHGGWSPGDAVEVWASVLAGPFAGLWATATWDWPDAVSWAAVCAVAMAAHPLHPGKVTGAISLVGTALWVLLGLALTYDGV